MATLNSVSRGAVTQDLVSTQETGFTLANGNDRTRVNFRTSAFLNPPNSGGTFYFDNFRNQWGGVLTAEPRYVLVIERDSLDNVVAQTVGQIVEIDRESDQNSRISGTLRLDMTVIQNWEQDARTDQTRYIIRLQERAPVSAHEPFTFNSDVILPGSTNISVLGTDAQGRIIPGQGGSRYTSGDTFLTQGPDSANPGQMINPSQGDFHNLTANISGGTAVAQRAVNVVTQAGGTARYINYGTASQVFADFSTNNPAFFNIEINTNRNFSDPQLTGVQGNTHRLWWRRNGSTLDSDWNEIGAVIDSTPNGNTARVRISTTRSDGSTITVDQMRLISNLDELGVSAPAQATNMGGGVDIDAGLFIYDGVEWQRFEVPVGSVGTGAGVSINITGEGGTTVTTTNNEDYVIDSVLYKSALQTPPNTNARVDTTQAFSNGLAHQVLGRFTLPQPNPRVLTGDVISLVVFNDLAAQVQRASLINYTVTSQNASLIFIPDSGPGVTAFRNALGTSGNANVGSYANDFAFRGPILPLEEVQFDLSSTELAIDTGLDWVAGDKAYLANTARGDAPTNYINIDVDSYDPVTGVLGFSNLVEIIGTGAELINLRDFEINYSVPVIEPQELTFSDTANNGNILGVDFNLDSNGNVTGTVNASGISTGGGSGSALTVIDENGATVSTDVSSITFAGAEVEVTELGTDGIITVTVTGETFNDSTAVTANRTLGINFTEVGNSVSAVTTPITSDILNPLFGDSANSGGTLGVDFTNTGSIITASVDAQSILDATQTIGVFEGFTTNTATSDPVAELRFSDSDFNLTGGNSGSGSTDQALINLAAMPASANPINYTDTNVQVVDTATTNNIGTADEGTTIRFEGVEDDLAWQDGQIGYSYSGDLGTLFTFQVATNGYNPTAGTLTVDIPTDGVVRTDDRPHGRYLIFAGAPTVNPTIPTQPTVTIPELSTVSVGSGAFTLEVYTVNVIEDATGTKSLPLAANVVDGDFVIVHNNTASNISISGGNYTLGVNESVTFVWHSVGNEWVVTSDAKTTITAASGINYTDTNTVLGNGIVATGAAGTTVTFTNVADDLAWQTGQQGYSYSFDLETLFTYQVLNYNASAGTLQVTINDVVRTDGLAHGRYLIFAGAPTVSATAPTQPTVNVPELSTVPSVLDNRVLAVYTLSLIGDDASGMGIDPAAERRRLPRSNNLSDGDFVIVQNQKADPVVINRNGGIIDGTSNSVLLRSGETIKFVYSTVPQDYITSGGAVMQWITTAEFGTELMDVSGTMRIVLSTPGSTGPQIFRMALPTVSANAQGNFVYQISHNLGFAGVPIVQVWEGNELVLPMSVNANSNNQVTITFPVAVSGTAVIMG